jgi:hypothetical protein
LPPDYLLTAFLLALEMGDLTIVQRPLHLWQIRWFKHLLI